MCCARVFAERRLLCYPDGFVFLPSCTLVVPNQRALLSVGLYRLTLCPLFPDVRIKTVIVDLRPSQYRLSLTSLLNSRLSPFPLPFCRPLCSAILYLLTVHYGMVRFPCCIEALLI